MNHQWWPFKHQWETSFVWRIFPGLLKSQNMGGHLVYLLKNLGLKAGSGHWWNQRSDIFVRWGITIADFNAELVLEKAVLSPSKGQQSGNSLSCSHVLFSGRGDKGEKSMKRTQSYRQTANLSSFMMALADVQPRTSWLNWLVDRVYLPIRSPGAPLLDKTWKSKFHQNIVLGSLVPFNGNTLEFSNWPHVAREQKHQKDA